MSSGRRKRSDHSPADRTPRRAPPAAPKAHRQLDDDGDESDFEFEWAIHPHLIDIPNASPLYHSRMGVVNTLKAMDDNMFTRLHLQTSGPRDANVYMQHIAKGAFDSDSCTVQVEGANHPVVFPDTGRGLPWFNGDGHLTAGYQDAAHKPLKYLFHSDTVAPAAWHKSKQDHAFFFMRGRMDNRAGLIVVRNVVRNVTLKRP